MDICTGNQQSLVDAVAAVLNVSTESARKLPGEFVVDA